MNILQIAKVCKFAGECDWICKISQKRSKFGFFIKRKMVFSEKNLDGLKMAKGSKFAVECDWKSKNSRNVQS